jgi:hypothetical protein
MPPALISGSLLASMTAEMMTATEAWVGPTDSASSPKGPYGRIQELGGPMTGNFWMHWKEDGAWYRRHIVKLLDRPYLAPATADVIDSGELHAIYEAHQLEAIMEATG